ncbi:uncharacterized protein LOC133323169 [Musca vetustissima]|uniref:uncharacterized protein LOC133323169 n=1 Tax=Musca vetustissima TaxID=27455 RepID=UPI002AB74B53|nr:uncharacterized protein LOC133323169 [Musca vetustissima]
MLPEPSKFKINTQFFSPHDLNLFVESLETIRRLTIEKQERKQQRKAAQLAKAARTFNTLTRIHSESCLDRSSADEIEEEPAIMHLENKKVPSTPDSQRSQYDESYFSAPNSAQSSPRNSVIYNQQLNKDSDGSLLSITISTDSEESGVFPIGASSQDLYDAAAQNSPIRPRSKLVNKKRSLSTRSRLIGLVLKKETAPKTPVVQLLSCRPLDEYETLEMYEQEQQQQQLNNVLQAETEKLSRFSTLHMRKKSRQGFACADGSSEERFLDKALRYLTL